MATASGTNETNKNAKPYYNESGECKIEVDFKKPILIFFNEKQEKRKFDISSLILRFPYPSKKVILEFAYWLFCLQKKQRVSLLETYFLRRVQLM